MHEDKIRSWRQDGGRVCENIPEKCTEKAMVVAVVRYKASVQRVDVGKADREFEEGKKDAWS